MRVKIVIREAEIFPLDLKRILVKGLMNKEEIKRHVFSLFMHNPWLLEYIESIRAKVEAVNQDEIF